MDVLGALIAQRRMDQQGINNLINVMQQISEKKRLQNLSHAFYKHGDFTPEGIKKFAEKNKLSIPEMMNLVGIMAKFNEYAKSRKPKLYQVNRVDKSGNTYTQLVPENALTQGGIQTGIGKPAKPFTVSRGEAVYNDKTGKWYVPNPVESAPWGKPYKQGNQWLQKNLKTNQIRSLYKESSSNVNLNTNVKILDTSIKVLRDRLPQGNIFTDITAEDLMNSPDKQNYIQMFQKAAKSKDLYTKQAALRGLKAINDILGPFKRRLTDPQIAYQYLQKANGDKQKARELARQDGWSF